MKQLKKKALSFDTLQLAPIPRGKKVFFASDFHLGRPDHVATRAREKKIVSWLDSIQPVTHALFLLGDVFDFWIEYKHVIPRGFARFQGKLAAFTDQHIPVYFLIGNHDLWMHDYFFYELNITILRTNVSVIINGKKFLVGHGDALGGSSNYRLVKRFVYDSPACRWLFRQLHPSVGIPLVRYLFNKRCKKNALSTFVPREDLIFNFCKEVVEPYLHHDFYVFGHLHRPYHATIHATSAYYNIGDWISHFTYGVFGRDGFELLQFA